MRFLRRLKDADPWRWTLVLLATNLALFWLLYSALQSTQPGVLVYVVAPLLFLTPCLAVVVVVSHFYHHRRTAGSINRLVVAYVELVVLFAMVYFWIIFTVEVAPIQGIESPWVWRDTPGDGRYLDLTKLRDAAVDSLHFSVVTMSTLGYGDMLPKAWYAKLIVDIQVLVGLTVVVVGIGNALGREPKEEHR